jgi:transcription-repair coupling factor (superfamily II helicase)
LDVSGDFKYERINTLLSLENNHHIIVLNLNAAIHYTIEPKLFYNSILRLKKNDDYDIEELTKKISYLGYNMHYTVRKTGDFSRRGSIVDIFPLNSLKPIRLDFFGDTIDTIKEFDPETQKSDNEIDNIEILPVSEFLLTDIEAEKASKKIKEDAINLSKEEEEKVNSDILDISLKRNLDTKSRYIKYMYDSYKTIFDYSKGYRLYLNDLSKIRDSYNLMEQDMLEYTKTLNGEFFNYKYYLLIEELEKMADIKSERLVDIFDNGIKFFLEENKEYKGNLDEAFKDLKLKYKDIPVILSIYNEARLTRIKDYMIDNQIPFANISDINRISKGMINLVTEVIPSVKFKDLLWIIDENALFEVKYDLRKPKYKSVYKNTSKISKYDELEINDYVVHYDYGIGKYLGIKALETNGIVRDYLNIEFDGGTLYVPLEQISRIEKYSASEAHAVKLTKLGTKQWENAKKRVRSKIKDISNDLIKLYANRENSIGFKHLPDTTEQVMFESDFSYELTKDQKRAIDDVKRDMESDKVMDRLVCGDVGYGKTEVALRAAFKAIMSGKQVALLCPTTILSRQHFLTFKERMESFGVEVALLNRFIKPSNVKKIKEDLLTGKIDMIVGTHKILAHDIKFKDLGLLIIDEEQRFGVLHKERIKEMKVNVDTITLSATPIPRTLQMSLAGIKQLSMIETPPKNRYPVQTYVLERNDAIIRDAIMRELSRGGQVFYLYNFTEDIENVAAHIKTLVPDARICIGYGKMDKDELEEVIEDFIDKKYDVIVCTTIIETGIDIPDTNTLIVHDANRLGLSQLYQLRGRVGRSNKIAYAYMMYEPRLILTDEARKRLETIKEFNELGSGFKIAMRDLAIRGAGDLLGSEQSGFIDSVGIEMYLHILDEEMGKIKKEESLGKVTYDPSLQTPRTNRHISDNYISNEDIKIEIHKKIDKLKTLSDLKNLTEELHDRFGDFSKEIDLYMYEKVFNELCKKLDIDHISDTQSQIILFMSKPMSNSMDGNLMFRLQNEISKELSLNYYNHMIQIIMDKRHYKDASYLYILVSYMDRLLKEMGKK